MFGMAPASKDAYRLFAEGTLSLSRLESTGMPVDEQVLAENRKAIAEMIRDKETELRDSPIYYRQRRKYGKLSNLNSRNQLSYILFDELGIEGGTKGNNNQYVLAMRFSTISN